jgi:hypothetical protein
MNGKVSMMESNSDTHGHLGAALITSAPGNGLFRRP